MDTSSSSNQQDSRPAIIQFSDHKNADILQSRSRKDEKRLRRRDSTASHTIIAYRTLSITVSESQAKGVNKSKKSKLGKADITEGKNNTKCNNYAFLKQLIRFD